MMVAGINAMGAGMKKSLVIRIVGMSLLAAAPLAQAADGLVAPAAETLWPRWQARIAVQAASVSPLATTNLFDAGGAQRGVRGGALFGDYYFATPSFGSFRASGGVVSGSLAGLPLATAAAGTRLGLSVSSAALPLNSIGADAASASPYLGLGFSGAPWHNGLSISADIGLIAERPGTAPGSGRAVFGSQAMDNAVRELRLSPLLQLGVRDSF
jgi:hypothetical protein